MLRTTHCGILTICTALLLCFSVRGMDGWHATLAPLPPLSPHWKGVAYQGMIDRISPKHVQNVKFLFLGDPVPAVVQKHGRATGLYGYGGLVAVRKKSFLGLVLQTVRFYLVDASGVLIKLTDVNDMEEETTMPEFHRVVVTVTGEYKPNPNYVPPSGKNDREKEKGKDRGKGRREERRHGRDDGRREPEHTWVTSEEKKIFPVLDAYQEERLAAFKDAHIDRQPVYQ